MPLLLCPNDNGPMQTVQRSGVEFDICPTCRGIWLDRGELEKLLDTARADDSGGRPAPAPIMGAMMMIAPRRVHTDDATTMKIIAARSAARVSSTSSTNWRRQADSQTRFDRIIDPNDGNVTIETLQRAVVVLGRRVHLGIVGADRWLCFCALFREVGVTLSRAQNLPFVDQVQHTGERRILGLFSHCWQRRCMSAFTRSRHSSV